MSKKVPIQAIQFSISTQFSFLLPIDTTLLTATFPSLMESGNDGSEGVLCIPQISSITETSPSECLVSYPGHFLEGSYPSTEKQSVYSTPPADCATIFLLCGAKTAWVSSVFLFTVCLFFSCSGFHGISILVGYPRPNPFYSNEQFYFKQFRTQFICQKHFYLKLFSFVKQFKLKQLSLV